jgi:hypothetical protein
MKPQSVCDARFDLSQVEPSLNQSAIVPAISSSCGRAYPRGAVVDSDYRGDWVDKNRPQVTMVFTTDAML